MPLTLPLERQLSFFQNAITELLHIYGSQPFTLRDFLTDNLSLYHVSTHFLSNGDLSSVISYFSDQGWISTRENSTETLSINVGNLRLYPFRGLPDRRRSGRVRA